MVFDEKAPRRVYGSYQVRRVLIQERNSALVNDHILCRICSGGWSKRKSVSERTLTFTPQNLSAAGIPGTATLLFSFMHVVDHSFGFVLRHRQLMLRVRTSVLGLYLKALTPVPSCPVDYQLWLAHQEDPKKDVHKGTNLSTDQWSLPAAVSPPLLPAEANDTVLTDKVSALGFSHFLPYAKVPEYTAGYLKDDHITVGVHISVPLTDVVISSNLYPLQAAS